MKGKKLSMSLALLMLASFAVPGHAEPASKAFTYQGRLREAGFEVEESRQLWGRRRAFAIGPGGHRVELMEAPPPRSG